MAWMEIYTHLPDRRRHSTTTNTMTTTAATPIMAMATTGSCDAETGDPVWKANVNRKGDKATEEER